MNQTGFTGFGRAPERSIYGIGFLPNESPRTPRIRSETVILLGCKVT